MDKVGPVGMLAMRMWKQKNQQSNTSATEQVRNQSGLHEILSKSEGDRGGREGRKEGK